MKKQIFISFLIIAFINYINGCSITNTERITPDKLTLTEEIIEEAVLLNLDVVKFNNKGARYLKLSDRITGKSKNGRPIELLVDQINEFRISNNISLKPEELKNRNINIFELVLKNNRLITFDKNGGMYDEKERRIVGKDKSQNILNIPIDRISEIYTEPAVVVNKYVLYNQKDIRLTAILAKENNILYIFDQAGGKLITQDQKIIGFNEHDSLVSIDPDSVLYLNVKRLDVTRSILASVGIIALGLGAIVLIIAATKESCPFIYSFDGDKYVFDAEPLGGATTKGLERTDYSKMDYLKNVNNSYEILVRNEVEETQYIDELSLLAINHDEDKEVYPDLNGNFYQIKQPIVPICAIDEKGLNLKQAVSADDNLYWQSKLPVDSNLIAQNHRHELTFTFPKATTKTKAKLIANVGTSLWGSRMIREMLQLYGNYIDNYYEKINEHGNEYQQMMNFIETEELYKLKYYTKNGDDWKFQGFINGGGPLVSETRVYDLDLSNICGDSVTIKINPPYGFWTVDYLAIQYDEYMPPIVKTINLKTVINNEETEIIDLIKTKDYNYCIMPNVGDYFVAKFSDKENVVDSNTSFYLKSSGYYEIHLDKSLPIQMATLSKFILEQGFIIKYANQRYSEWEKLKN